MAQASRVGARISLSKVPVLNDAWQLAAAGVVPEGTHNNHRYLREQVSWDSGISREAQLILCDAQTSGGLLIAVAPAKEGALLTAMAAAGVTAAVIGHIIEGDSLHVAK